MFLHLRRKCLPVPFQPSVASSYQQLADTVFFNAKTLNRQCVNDLVGQKNTLPGVSGWCTQPSNPVHPARYGMGQGIFLNLTQMGAALQNASAFGAMAVL